MLIIFCFALCIVKFVVLSVLVTVMGLGKVCIMFLGCLDGGGI